jgi:hypothetical protein
MCSDVDVVQENKQTGTNNLYLEKEIHISLNKVETSQ